MIGCIAWLCCRLTKRNEDSRVEQSLDDELNQEKNMQLVHCIPEAIWDNIVSFLSMNEFVKFTAAYSFVYRSRIIQFNFWHLESERRGIDKLAILKLGQCNDYFKRVVILKQFATQQHREFEAHCVYTDSDRRDAIARCRQVHGNCPMVYPYTDFALSHQPEYDIMVNFRYDNGNNTSSWIFPAGSYSGDEILEDDVYGGLSTSKVIDLMFEGLPVWESLRRGLEEANDPSLPAFGEQWHGWEYSSLSIVAMERKSYTPVLLSLQFAFPHGVEKYDGEPDANGDWIDYWVFDHDGTKHHNHIKAIILVDQARYIIRGFRLLFEIEAWEFESEYFIRS